MSIIKRSIYGITKDQLEDYFVSKELAKYRATQVFESIYRMRYDSFNKITNIKKDVLAMLDNDFSFNELKIVEQHTSSDGTTKFLFELEDKNLIETVLMVHEYGYSVCVTTQVGCNMGCKFCASGIVKKIRNLETYEIVLQVLTIDNYLRKSDKRVSHVVIMGIGEPFDNYDNVMDFIKIINEPKGLEIGSRHITLSTCGLVPKIKEFASFPLQVNLAISLHFATNEKRSKYMPINKKYQLDELFDALEYYYQQTNRRITLEYILLKDIHDSLQDARELAKYAQRLNCYINLIPYNETGVFKRSTIEARDAFFNELNKLRVNAIIRKEHGHDIDAACGQLRVKRMNSGKQ